MGGSGYEYVKRTTNDASQRLLKYFEQKQGSNLSQVVVCGIVSDDFKTMKADDGRTLNCIVEGYPRNKYMCGILRDPNTVLIVQGTRHVPTTDQSISPSYLLWSNNNSQPSIYLQKANSARTYTCAFPSPATLLNVANSLAYLTNYTVGAKFDSTGKHLITFTIQSVTPNGYNGSDYPSPPYIWESTYTSPFPGTYSNSYQYIQYIIYENFTLNKSNFSVTSTVTHTGSFSLDCPTVFPDPGRWTLPLPFDNTFSGSYALNSQHDYSKYSATITSLVKTANGFDVGFKGSGSWWTLLIGTAAALTNGNIPSVFEWQQRQSAVTYGFVNSSNSQMTFTTNSNQSLLSTIGVQEKNLAYRAGSLFYHPDVNVPSVSISDTYQYSSAIVSFPALSLSYISLNTGTAVSAPAGAWFLQQGQTNQTLNASVSPWVCNSNTPINEQSTFGSSSTTYISRNNCAVIPNSTVSQLSKFTLKNDGTWSSPKTINAQSPSPTTGTLTLQDVYCA